MSSRTAARMRLVDPATDRPTFSALLKSKPVPLAGYGESDLGQLAVVYNQGACMRLLTERVALIGDLQDTLDAQVAEMQTALADYQHTWGPAIAAQAAATLSPEERIARLVTILTDPQQPAAARLESVRLAVAAESEVGGESPAPWTAEDQAAFEAASTALEAVLTQMTQAIDATRVRLHQRIISLVVVGIGVPQARKDSFGRDTTVLTWPWAGDPPDPAHPETFAVLDADHPDDWVQRWIALEGPKEVRAAMRSPLFGTLSTPITTADAARSPMSTGVTA